MKRYEDMTRDEMVAVNQAMRGRKKALEAAKKETVSDLPADTVKILVESLGYDEAVKAVAEAIKAIGLWDLRISKAARAWADTVDTLTAEEIMACANSYSDIHPAHINQIAEAMMEYTPAEEITGELETVETDAKDDLSDLARDFADNYEDCATRFDDLLAEAADSSVPVYTAKLLDFVREEPDAVEDYINENGWPGSLDTAAAGAIYERNYNQLDGELDDIKWYFAVKALCEYSVGNVTTEAAGDILADLADRLDFSIMSPVDCRMAAEEAAEKYGWL